MCGTLTKYVLIDCCQVIKTKHLGCVAYPLALPLGPALHNLTTIFEEEVRFALFFFLQNQGSGNYNI